MSDATPWVDDAAPVLNPNTSAPAFPAAFAALAPTTDTGAPTAGYTHPTEDEMEAHDDDDEEDEGHDNHVAHDDGSAHSEADEDAEDEGDEDDDGHAEADQDNTHSDAAHDEVHGDAADLHDEAHGDGRANEEGHDDEDRPQDGDAEKAGDTPPCPPPTWAEKVQSVVDIGSEVLGYNGVLPPVTEVPLREVVNVVAAAFVEATAKAHSEPTLDAVVCCAEARVKAPGSYVLEACRVGLLVPVGTHAKNDPLRPHLVNVTLCPLLGVDPDTAVRVADLATKEAGAGLGDGVSALMGRKMSGMREWVHFLIEWARHTAVVAHPFMQGPALFAAACARRSAVEPQRLGPRLRLKLSSTMGTLPFTLGWPWTAPAVDPVLDEERVSLVGTAAEMLGIAEASVSAEDLLQRWAAGGQESEDAGYLSSVFTAAPSCPERRAAVLQSLASRGVLRVDQGRVSFFHGDGQGAMFNEETAYTSLRLALRCCVGATSIGLIMREWRALLVDDLLMDPVKQLAVWWHFVWNGRVTGSEAAGFKPAVSLEDEAKDPSRKTTLATATTLVWSPLRARDALLAAAATLGGGGAVEKAALIGAWASTYDVARNMPEPARLGMFDALVAMGLAAVEVDGAKLTLRAGQDRPRVAPPAQQPVFFSYTPAHIEPLLKLLEPELPLMITTVTSHSKWSTEFFSTQRPAVVLDLVSCGVLAVGPPPMGDRISTLWKGPRFDAVGELTERRLAVHNPQATLVAAPALLGTVLAVCPSPTPLRWLDAAIRSTELGLLSNPAMARVSCKRFTTRSSALSLAPGAVVGVAAETVAFSLARTPPARAEKEGAKDKERDAPNVERAENMLLEMLKQRPHTKGKLLNPTREFPTVVRRAALDNLRHKGRVVEVSAPHNEKFIHIKGWNYAPLDPAPTRGEKEAQRREEKERPPPQWTADEKLFRKAIENLALDQLAAQRARRRCAPETDRPLALNDVQRPRWPHLAHLRSCLHVEASGGLQEADVEQMFGYVAHHALVLHFAVDRVRNVLSVVFRTEEDACRVASTLPGGVKQGLGPRLGTVHVTLRGELMERLSRSPHGVQAVQSISDLFGETTVTFDGGAATVFFRERHFGEHDCMAMLEALQRPLFETCHVTSAVPNASSTPATRGGRNDRQPERRDERRGDDRRDERRAPGHADRRRDDRPRNDRGDDRPDFRRDDRSSRDGRWQDRRDDRRGDDRRGGERAEPFHHYEPPRRRERSGSPGRRFTDRFDRQGRTKGRRFD